MIHRRRSLYDLKRTFAGRLESEWRSIFRLLRVRLTLSGLFLNAFLDAFLDAVCTTPRIRECKAQSQPPPRTRPGLGSCLTARTLHSNASETFRPDEKRLINPN